ncbi:MAG: DUF5681 domain-containing protein [Pseudomonadota bacterium]
MGKFQKGQSGNPAGKPKGARHRTTRAVEALLEGEAEGLTRKAVELALDGDTTALRLCLERIAPARKDNPIRFSMPAMKSSADASTALRAILEATADGEITPCEANSLSGLIDSFARALELQDLEQRLSELEDGRNAKS